MENEVTFVLRIPKKFKDKLELIAVDEKRSLNSQILYMLEALIKINNISNKEK